MSIIESLSKMNIISNNNDTIFTLDYGYVIDLFKTCKFLFGVNKLPITVSLLELEAQNIVIQYNEKYYICIDKFDKFINMVGKLVNQQDNYILINYYNIYNYDLENFNSDLYLWWIGIKEYLSEKKGKNYDIIKYIIGDQLFNGFLSNYQNKIWTIIFKSATTDILLTFGYDDIVLHNYINVKNCNYKKLVRQLIKEFLLSNPDNFIIENLTKVTGSKEFSKLLLESHKNKNNYTIPVDQLDNIIQYKSKKYKTEFIQYFITNISKDCYQLQDKQLILNFKGLNKYFLTINEKYLISFEMKDIINDFYTNITEELIDSYKLLYEYNSTKN